MKRCLRANSLEFRKYQGNKYVLNIITHLIVAHTPPNFHCSSLSLPLSVSFYPFLHLLCISIHGPWVYHTHIHIHFYVFNNDYNNAYITGPHHAYCAIRFALLLIDVHHTEKCTSILSPSFNDGWFVEYFSFNSHTATRRDGAAAAAATVKRAPNVFAFCRMNYIHYIDTQYVRR